MSSKKRSIVLFCFLALGFFLILASLFRLDANHIAFASIKVNAKSTCLQPPAHIDIDKLSDAQLEAYGIPPHSVLQSDPKWSERLTNYKSRSCGTYTYHHSKMVRKPSPYSTRYISSNWAGNQAIRGGYNYADGYWNIPLMNTSVRSSTATVWVGLGTGNSINDPLVQTGIDNNVSSGGNVTRYAWVEVWYNNGTQNGHDDQLGVTFTQGLNSSDHIEAYVSIGAGRDFFWLENYRTHEVVSPNNIPNPNNGHWPLSNGSTVECIVEKLDAPLANYNYINFTQCSVGPSGNYINQEPNDYFETYSGSQEIQWVGPMSGTGNFAVHYGHT